ncbi:MAG: anti-sigma factor [Sneathiella sp.]|nr:anti-sigma factor [Sneathiella sp.]
MTENTISEITENDLHAYVDEQLSGVRREEVERYLQDNPEQAKLVQSWAEQNVALKDLYRPAQLDGDQELVRKVARGRTSTFKTVARIAAAILIFLAGGALGSYITLNVGVRENTPQYVQTLGEASRAGFAIYASEVRHPVEVNADQEEHLVTWLGKRLGTKFRAPKLQKEGFNLVGGRLVPFAGKPGALLMYENAAGERLTVLIGHQPSNAETGFRFVQEGDIRTFYWIDGKFGYALSGSIDRPLLQVLAREIYRQIDVT